MTATDYRQRAAEEYRDLRRSRPNAEALQIVAARYSISEKTLRSWIDQRAQVEGEEAHEETA
jgi:hypothetical protein